MGVPRLFYWLKQEYPSVLIQLMENQNFPYKRISVDCYALDVNAIIHPVCQKIYNYGSVKPEKKVPRLLHRARGKVEKKVVPINEPINVESTSETHKGESLSDFLENLSLNDPTQVEEKKDLSPEQLEKNTFYEICKVIEAMRQIVRPQKLLYLAVDGVAGLSKCVQQRGRRFKSSFDRPDEQTFNSNQITTGSEFMYRFSHYVHNYIKTQLQRNNWWKGLEVIFSNEKVVGEGEHKIIRFMADNPQYTYCVHSPDADLILLTLGLVNNVKNVYIIRENIYDFVNCKYFVIKVNELRTELLKKISWSSDIHTFDKNLAIYDFILTCSLLGNDFLSHIPSLEISNSGLDILMEIFPLVTMEHGHFVTFGGSTKRDLNLNTKSLTALFKILASKEPELLLRKANSGLKFPDTLLNAHVVENKVEVAPSNGDVNSNEKKQPSINSLNFKKYRVEYNKQRLGGHDIGDICKEYLKGLLFVLRYYVSGMPNWHWTFPFHHSPLFDDLARYTNEFDGEMKFDRNSPLTPFEQLLAVLPRKSSKLLPLALRPLIEDEDSVISDFYPNEFEILLEGKNQEYEAVVILPFIDVSRLKKAYNSVQHLISDEDRKRNMMGKSSKYVEVGGIVKVSVI